MINWFKKKYDWFIKSDSETKVAVVFTTVALLVFLMILTSCGSPSTDDTWLYKAV